MNAKTETPLDKFRNLSYRYGLDHEYQSLWPGLYFTPRGMGRLMNVAGFITTLDMLGQTDTAVKLATDLDQQLNRLADYGQKRTVEALRSDMTSLGEGEVQAFMVVLGDDGTFGGFTVAWYRHVPDRVRWETREETGVDPALEAGSFKRVVERRVEYRFEDKSGTSWWLDQHYKFAFNGGLILHGMGNQVFSVDISSKEGPHWSLHT